MSQEMQFGIKIKADGKVAIGVADEVKRKYQEVGEEFKKVSKESAWVARQLPMQFTDIVVGLTSGQSPFQVLIQQGGQIKDMYGGIGPAIGAMAGYVAGLVNPFTLSAAAATAMGYAVYSSLHQPVEPAKDLKTAISDLDKAVGDVGKTAHEFSMEKVYKEFNAANAVAREGIVEQLRFQQTMIETQMMLSRKSLASSLDGLGDYTFLDKMKGAFADTGAEKLAKQLGVSVELAKDMLPAIKGLRDNTDDAGNFMQRFGIELAASSKSGAQALLKDIRDIANGSADAAGAQSRLTEALQKMAAAGSTKKITLEADTKQAKHDIDEYMALMNRLTGEEANYSATYIKDAQTIARARDLLGLSNDKVAESMLKLYRQQPVYIKAMKDQAAATEELQKAGAKLAGALDNDVESLRKKLEQEQRAYELAGLTKAQQDELIAQEYEKLAVEWELNSLAVQAEINAGHDAENLKLLNAKIQEQIELYIKLANIKRSDAITTGAKESADEFQKAWKSVTDDINRNLVDAIWEGSLDGGEMMKKYFKTLVLTPIVNAITKPIYDSTGKIIGTAIDTLSKSSSSGSGSGNNTYIEGASNAYTGYQAYGTLTGTGASSTTGASSAAGSGGALESIGGMAGLGYIALIVAAFMGADYQNKFLNTKTEGDSFARIGSNGTAVFNGDKWVDGSSWYGGGQYGRLVYDGGNVQDSPGMRKILDDGGVKYTYQAPLGDALSERLDKASQSIYDLVAKLGGDASGLQIGLGASVGSHTQINSALADASGNVIFSKNRDNLDNGKIEQEMAVELERLMLGAVKASSVGDAFKVIANGIDLVNASAQQLAEAIASLDTMQTVMTQLGADPFADYAKSAAEASMSLEAQIDKQREAVTKAAAAYDGSLNSVNALASAVQTRYSLELQLAEQLADAVKSSTSLWSDFRREIELGGLTAAQKYDYFDAEIQKYYDTLATLTDTAAIQELEKKAEQSFQSAWATLSDQQKLTYKADFESKVDKFETRVDDRYKAVEDFQKTDNQKLKDDIAEAMREAANKISTAAATPHVVHVDPIVVKVEGGATTTPNVGGWANSN